MCKRIRCLRAPSNGFPDAFIEVDRSFHPIKNARSRDPAQAAQLYGGLTKAYAFESRTSSPRPQRSETGSRRRFRRWRAPFGQLRFRFFQRFFSHNGSNVKHCNERVKHIRTVRTHDGFPEVSRFHRRIKPRAFDVFALRRPLSARARPGPKRGLVTTVRNYTMDGNAKSTWRNIFQLRQFGTSRLKRLPLCTKNPFGSGIRKPLSQKESYE